MIWNRFKKFQILNYAHHLQSNMIDMKKTKNLIQRRYKKSNFFKIFKSVYFSDI